MIGYGEQILRAGLTYKINQFYFGSLRTEALLS